MPRVHTQRANKDYPTQGIIKGDTYYKWTLRPGGRGRGTLYRSATPPEPWQLTSSEFLQQQYQLEDRINNLTVDELSDVEEIIAEIEQLGEEQQDKLDNMEQYNLQDSPSGEMVRERVEGCEAWVSELQSIDIPEHPGEEPKGTSLEDDPDGDEHAVNMEEWREGMDTLERALEDVQNCAYPG